MSKTIICPLWDENDKRFRSRRYQAWDRQCGSCERKVVVSDVGKRQLDANAGTIVLCEQCALVQWQHASLEVGTDNERSLAESQPSTQANGREEPCAICEELKIREEAAALELARCKDLPDQDTAKTAFQKWAHLSRARLGHSFKAHKL